MQMILIDYPKPRNSEVKSFCDLAKRQWEDLPDETQEPVLIISCTAGSAEEIVPYMDEYYPEVNYGISIIPNEKILEGEVELLKGDLELARETIQSSKSAYWAQMTMMRHGIPRLRAEKAVRMVFEELRKAGSEDKESKDESV